MQIFRLQHHNLKKKENKIREGEKSTTVFHKFMTNK